MDCKEKLDSGKLFDLLCSSPKWKPKDGIWCSRGDWIEFDGEDIILNEKRLPICDLYKKDGAIYHKEIEGFPAVEKSLFADNGGGDWIET